MEENDLQIIRQSPLFRSLDEEQVRNVLQEGFSTVRAFGRGERVFSESDRPDKIRILLSGEVTVAKDTPGGKRSVLAVIDRPGDMFGEIYAFRNLDSYGMYAECTESSRILSLDICVLQIPVREEVGRKQEFRDMRDMETALKISSSLLQIFAEKAFQMNRRLRILGGTSIREKVARYLLDRQKSGNRVAVMSREDLADYLNVTRPSLSREISAMIHDGILAACGHDLVILDQKALEEYA
ncbi:Crp/Fnr family transcriptional regulator [Bilifractor porci]|uniref:Crp/Fnr family transcriptional regulator n=1 Tax=Bilifractor porci TaxID=2606636 RepID=A0A7X2P7E2_9FIRM|nr:Crp/Fnr family transcriptional regulator [Bilifractor porci]MST81615.1 Crp/Fnr family transcriptional regulator [Bilifractor porci]